MRLSRRGFLAASAATPVIAPVALDLVTTIEAAPSANSSVVFTEPERRALEAAMDEIIPATDGMPAASAIGALAYLTRIAANDADVAREIRDSLAALEKCSEKSSGKAFDQLDGEPRISVLRRLEKESPNDLAKLRDYVYEAYYTQPAIWKRVGYEFYPTDHPGPYMKPFDESILDPVRKNPKFYREA